MADGTYLDHAMMEAIMMRLISMMIVPLALSSASLDLWIGQAQASQGPGIAPGNASPMMQHAVALAVYGVAGVLLVVGLIGAVRRRGAR
jgi:hypothetical protein